MIREFPLPDLGEGLTESEIVAWRVAVGDRVELNQIIAEVETAKAVVELPSPYAGVITALHAAEGETVNVGEPLFSCDTGDGAEPVRRPSDAARMPQPAPRRAAAARRDGRGRPRRDPPAPARARRRARPEPRRLRRRDEAAEAPRPPPALAADLVPAVDAEVDATPRRRARPGHAGPSRRRPLATGAPSVPARRRRCASSRATSASTSERHRHGRARAHHPRRRRGRGIRIARGATPSRTTARPTTTAHPRPQRPAETRIPINGVRKHTAAAMVRSAFTAPHVTEFLTVDVTATMELLRGIRDDRAFAGHKVTPLTVVAKALCIAARRTPEVNSRWDEDAQEIVQFGDVNLGIAAATDRGLVVPNVKGAERMTLIELADAIAALADTARAGRTTPADLAGGTISITNIGVFGIDAGTPILNPGEAAILAMGAVRRQPWEYRGEIALREVMTLAPVVRPPPGRRRAGLAVPRRHRPDPARPGRSH